VRFWDTSALVPLFIAERESARAERWLRADPGVIVWMLTRVELLSAIARRRRGDRKANRVLRTARMNLLEAWTEWMEVIDMPAARRQAERLVETHPLRAADALQLGAALVACEGVASSLTFVTLDRNQAEAAEREGFTVLGRD
jgi:hypothetical protein